MYISSSKSTSSKVQFCRRWQSQQHALIATKAPVQLSHRRHPLLYMDSTKMLKVEPDILQAEDLGKLFRTVMYPRYGPAGNGFLRLHSTYRHDLKIYTSDEGRVQTSAAAFTQGLLDLEGTSLTPILVR